MKQKQVYVSPRSRVLQVMAEQPLLAGSIVGAGTSSGPSLGGGGIWGGNGGVDADVRRQNPSESNIW